MCCNILCFIGIHKWKPVETLSMPRRVSRKRKVYFRQEQCQRCCKLKQVGEPIDKKFVIRTSKSDIKNCNI